MVRDEAFFRGHIQKLRQEYRARRDLMLKLIEENFPAEVTWTHPEGGLFLMVTLPTSLDAGELLKQAVEQKVAYVPCNDFFIQDGVRNTLRINFSNARPEMIEAGIVRLGNIFKEALVAAPVK
jgi:2-aminoadipate transaminase